MTVSQRTFRSTGATLLGGLTADTALSAPQAAASTAGTGSAPTETGELALDRPVTASSTDYAPTPARFAVDRLSLVGVRGTGWRAAQGDPQWITVDLQAPCEIEAVTLVFETTLADPPFDGDYSATTGDEIRSSAATSFSLDVSTDGQSWQTVYETTSGPGGEVEIPLSPSVRAQYVRLTSTARSNTNPVGLNGFRIYGTCDTERPPVTGWTSWDALPQAAPPLEIAADGTVPVESGWSITLDDFAPSGATGASLSTPAAPAASLAGSWVPSIVPGTVQADLVARGHLPDPVNGFDNLNVPEALSRHNWWYRRPFGLPRGFDTSAGRHIWLEFDGINHQAVTWVDGTNVGTLTHPFSRAAYDITSALRSDSTEHVLAVEMSPMPHPGAPGDKSSNGDTFVQSAELYLDSPTYLAASGWDWMPAVRDRATGIWNHVRLRSTGDAVIGDPHVSTTLPNLPDTSVAEVTIAIPVSSAGAVTQTITVKAAFDDVSVSGSVSVAAGQSATVTFSPADHPQLTVHKPRLWWPNGYGEPALHDLEVITSVGGIESDRRGYRFGIREFGYSYEEPIAISAPAVSPLGFTDDQAPQTENFAQEQAGYSVTQLTISCNGVKIFCRGGNWGWDELLRRVLPDRLAQTVAMHRDMNFTMIRNWLGSSNREELYAACDENGILVWNDFWDCGMVPDEQSGYVAVATDTIRRYRIHPCIAVWCGANEAAPPPDLDAGLANAIAAEDSEIFYQANSADAPVSGHGPYHWVDPAKYYDKSTYDMNVFGFHTEIGIPVVSVLESMQHLVGDETPWPPSEVWNHHDWSPTGNQQVDTYRTAISDRLGASDTLADFCTKAQFVNYESMRAIFEAWTANLWQNTSAVLLWMSHPAWHSTVWQTYDYDLDVNGAYYGARKGCEPLHIQADPTSWRTVAANHTPNAVAGATITASVYDLNGNLLSRAEQQGLNIAAAGTTPGLTVTWPTSAPHLNLVRLDLADAQGKQLSQNTYWRYAAATDMQALSSLAQTRLEVRTSDGSSTSLTATVTNKGSVVAAMVRLSLRDQGGARILPTRYSDNYLWLLPGESRDVTIDRPGGGPVGQQPQIVVEAYNSETVVAH